MASNLGTGTGNTGNTGITPIVTPQSAVGTNTPLGALPIGTTVVPVAQITHNMRAAILAGNTFASKPIVARTRAGNITFAQWANGNVQAQAHLATFSALNKRAQAGACYTACQQTFVGNGNVQGIAALLLLVLGTGHCLPKGSALVREVRTIKGTHFVGLTGYIKPSAPWWPTAVSNGQQGVSATKALLSLLGVTQATCPLSALNKYLPSK